MGLTTTQVVCNIPNRAMPALAALVHEMGVSRSEVVARLLLQAIRDAKERHNPPKPQTCPVADDDLSDLDD